MLHSTKIVYGILIPIFLIAFASGSNAQDSQFAKKGIVELAGNLSFSSYTTVSNGKAGDAISIFVFAPQVGYFVVDGFELGLTTGISLLPGFSVISPEDGESTNILQLFFSPSYNLETANKNIYPFLEAQLGYTSLSSGNNTSSGFSYGGRVGVKVVAVEHMLLTFAAQYIAITLNEKGETERDGFNYLMFGVGISGYF